MIGTIGIIETGYPSSYKVTRKTKRKAAEIGGHAILIVDAGSETKEIESNMLSAMSVPRFFWWDDKPHYLGTDYFVIKPPNLSITTSYKAGIVIKFKDRTVREIVTLRIKKWKQALPKLKESEAIDEVVETLLKKDEEGKPKYHNCDLLKEINTIVFFKEIERMRAEWAKNLPPSVREQREKNLKDLLEKLKEASKENGPVH